MAGLIQELKSCNLNNGQVDKSTKYSRQNDATTKHRHTIPIYEQIGIKSTSESSKSPDLTGYIEMILKTGKEFHAGATYQTQDFSAVCIDESGGVVSLDHYDVTLLLPPLSLHEPCATVFLYMERIFIKRVHGNPRYASPVIRVGCISNSRPTLFQENLVLSFPLFKYTDNHYVVPFYQEDSTDLWIELSIENHAFVKDKTRCTMSIDKTGLYTCLNYTDSAKISTTTRIKVLPVQCCTFVDNRFDTNGIRFEVAFWQISDSHSEKAVQNRISGQIIDGSRELLLDVTDNRRNEYLVVDVTGICEGWTVYGGKQKHIPLSAIHEELQRPQGLYIVDFKFNRNQSYDVQLACKFRIYINCHENINKRKLSLFRYNCSRKRSMSDEINEMSQNRIAYCGNFNNSREILDVTDRCLAHITKIISSNLNGVWEKRFAESVNIPRRLVESATEIFLINKALYMFIGSRIFLMNDNDIVLDFITEANGVARELECEAIQRTRNRAIKSLSLPNGETLVAKPKCNRSISYSIDVSAHMSKCLATPPPRPPKYQSLPQHDSKPSTDFCFVERNTSLENVSPLSEDIPSRTKPYLQKQWSLNNENFNSSTETEAFVPTMEVHTPNSLVCFPLDTQGTVITSTPVSRNLPVNGSSTPSARPLLRGEDNGNCDDNDDRSTVTNHRDVMDKSQHLASYANSPLQKNLGDEELASMNDEVFNTSEKHTTNAQTLHDFSNSRWIEIKESTL